MLFSAASGSQPVTITVIDDSDIEDDEEFTLTLRDPLDPEEPYNCPNGNLGKDFQLHVIIKDNDGEFINFSVNK